jgi:TAT (twin-arginine translocation) pathway signal sequence
MTSRRRFLHASAAVAAASAIGGVGTVPGSPRKPAASPGRRLQLHAVVVDRRFDESVEFGREFALLGADTFSMRGDVTDVWYSQLYPLWKAGGAAVAGLTGNGVLFCLERLAWDHNLRVVYRGSHQSDAEGCIQHAMLGRADWSALSHDTASSNVSWPAAVAASLADLESPCPAVPTGRALRPVCSTALRGVGRRTDSPLFSWVIAPPARA